MKETIRAFCLLDRAGLLHNAEKAARVLGIWEVVTSNSNDGLWAIAVAPDVPVTQTSMVGSEPVLEIPTEPNPEFKAGPPPSPVKVKRSHHRAD